MRSLFDDGAGNDGVQKVAPEENCPPPPPAPQLALGFWLGLGVCLGLGAIFLGGFCLTTGNDTLAMNEQ